VVTVTARQLRVVRGAAAAAVTTELAAAAHTIGGGGAPAPALVAMVIVLAAPPAIALIGRRASTWRTATAVLAAQIVFHVVFAIFGSPAAMSAPLNHAGMATGGMAMGGLRVAPGAAAAGTATAGTAGAHGVMADAGMPDVMMVVTHLAAALITVLVLCHGERAIRAILRGIGRLLPLVHVPTPWPAHRVPIAVCSSPRMRSALFASDCLRRGPPSPAL
jgi:hypothetical protein